MGYGNTPSTTNATVSNNMLTASNNVAILEKEKKKVEIDRCLTLATRTQGRDLTKNHENVKISLGRVFQDITIAHFYSLFTVDTHLFSLNLNIWIFI